MPIVGTIFGALMLCLVAHYSSVTIDWTRTKDFTEAFINVTQSLALIAGGVWAYFKFAKGRTFQDRLSPSVSGKFVSIDEAVFLIVTTHLKNVGLSRIGFDQEVERQTLIALPWVSHIGYQLEFEVFSDSGYRWRATSIVDKSAFAHNEMGNLLGLERKS